ncbi:flavodoxin [Metabacillus herbersteinensis]|uniref:Flavodoxin n=1 Tax=Metabacillus herbersteinensis TaxID=283816 RepID=A0ABV6GBD7_9BACI
MKKVLITYVSMSGNTEDIANLLMQEFSEQGLDVHLEEMESTRIEDLTSYELILVGTYTWGNGDLPYETEEFYEGLVDAEISGLKAACFGSGDHAYPKFCEAVNLFYNQLSVCRSDVYKDTLKMEFGPETDDEIEMCREFAREIINWVLNEKGSVSHVS